MWLLADENVHGRVVHALRQRGFDLAWVGDGERGIADRALLDRPDMSSCVFLTNDRDFGELVFRRGLPAPLAILYTRTPHRDWELTASLIAAELEAGVVPGHLTIITSEGARRRAFPVGAENG